MRGRWQMDEIHSFLCSENNHNICGQSAERKLVIGSEMDFEIDVYWQNNLLKYTLE